MSGSESALAVFGLTAAVTLIVLGLIVIRMKRDEGTP
jgi:hypothetical protein